MPDFQSFAPPDDEVELLSRLRASDGAALKILFGRYHRYLCATAFQFLADAEKSKDMAQDVFFELWKRRAELDIRTSLKSYLRRACANKCINFLKAQRLDFSEPEQAERVQPNAEPSAQELLEGQNAAEAIDRALTKLPPQCRAVFVLSRIDLLSHREISEKLGISTKTIENQITKALKILRAELRPLL